MPKKTLIFPRGGVNTRTSYQSQPPFTTRSALNVVPEEGIEGRDRGGSRPGLIRGYTLSGGTALGSGNPVNLLSSVRHIANTGPGIFVQDDFTVASSTPSSDYWDTSFNTSSWSASSANLTINDSNDTLVNTNTGAGFRGLLLNESSGVGFVGTDDINFAEPVTIQYTIESNDVSYWAWDYRSFYVLFFMEGGSSADPSDQGCWVGFDAVIRNISTRTVIRPKFRDYEDGGTLNRSYDAPEKEFPNGATRSHTVRIRVTPNVVSASGIRPRFEMFIDGMSVLSVNALSSFDWEGGVNRIAVLMGKDTTIDGAPEPDPELSRFSIQYSSLAHASLPPEILVAAANGTLYREENPLGEVAAVASDTASGIEYADAVSTKQRLGNLYIADYQVLVDERGTVDATLNFGGSSSNLLRHVGKDFSALGVTTTDRIEVTAAGESAAIGVYKISAVGTTTLTLAATNDVFSTVTGLTDEVSGVSYRIMCGPKVYDPSEDTLSVWHHNIRTTDNAQAIPIGCRIVSAYKDRMILAGDDTGVVYMSRAGDPNDWDFSVSDSDDTRAVGLGAADSTTAGLPEAVTAIIPHSDDYLLIASKSTLWVLRGDPARGGVLDNLSYKIGCIGRFAYVNDPEGGVFFLTRNGIYYQPRGASVSPQKISKLAIPQDLLGVDTSVTEPFLSYDFERDGLWIFLAPKSVGTMRSWFFDVESAGFFPVDYPDQLHHPRSVYSYEPETQAFSKTLLGGKDGFIREIGGDTDDGAFIVSEVKIGPVRLGNPGGFCEDLEAVLDESSSSVNWVVTVGDAEQEAVSDIVAGGTWSSGHNYLDRPKAGGKTMYLGLSSAEQWALEYITIRTRDSRGHMPL